MRTAHEAMREAAQKHGITAAEIASEMRRQHLCGGREEELVQQLLGGGTCVWGVAMALIELIITHKHATIH